MRKFFRTRPLWATLFLLQVIAFGGCSRSKYRLAADREAYDVIAERNGNSRWNTTDYSIEIDPRSRYFDSYDPDCPPMPRDDPAAHQYMHCVNGMKGWKHWGDNGVRETLENPAWQVMLAGYTELDEDGSVKLDIDSALELAYIHSPGHQRQLDTLYLSSLDVTTERFRLDTQYFGGYNVNYLHQGSLIPPALRFVPALGRFAVIPATKGVESNGLVVGRPSVANPALQASRRYATAGQLLASFANSFVFEFHGPSAGLSASLLELSFLQPLLAGGGRDIALEQLTFFERTLLANLRSYAQFRQGFYTQVAIGELGVTGPQRGGRGANLQVFSGQAGLGGYVGLLQQLQQIRNAEDNLNLQLRTLSQLEALLDAGLIDLVQVDQFRQNVERDRASLLQLRNDFLRALDGYKTGTLGLPPDLPVDLDDDMIRQFQLVDRDATAVQDAIAQLQDQIGALPNDADSDAIQSIRLDVFELVEPLKRQIEVAQHDLSVANASIPHRQRFMTEIEMEQFADEIAKLAKGVSELGQQFADIQQTVHELQEGSTEDVQPAESDLESDVDDVEADGLSSGISPAVRDTVILLRDMLRLVQGTILVQARARLEAVSVDAIDLDSEDAFRIALENRLDFMNGRAALVDEWRSIQVSADALQSVLNFRASGNIRTARNNPLSFRAPTSTARLGLEFDAPLTRLVERNAYRESLINYQRSRRDLIQSRDSLHLDLRVLLRQIEQLRTNLEIQRRAVAIAIRRVDLTRAALYAPVPPPQPGQRAAPFGPTAAINLLSAQSAVRDTQNSFMSVWLNYYAAKMRLARELGIMSLDPDGRWIETPLPGSQQDAGSIELLPPPLGAGMLEEVNSLPEDFTFEAPANAQEVAPLEMIE